MTPELTLPTCLQQDYHLVEVLQTYPGRATYLAESATSGAYVVLKTVSLSELNDWHKLEAFQAEIKVMKQLSHPSIPAFIAEGKDDDITYFAQAFIPGQTLRQRLVAGPLTETEAKHIGLALTEVLSYLHGLNPPVIHQDLKPENILLGADEGVYLLDFGAVADLTGEQGPAVAGTFGYMPPEQAAGQMQPASDLYALGVTLIEALSGQAPTSLPQNQDLRLLYHEQVDLSEPFQQWLDDLTDPIGEQRPQNGTEARAWLLAEPRDEATGRLSIKHTSAELTQIHIAPALNQKPTLELFIESVARQKWLIGISWVVCSITSMALGLALQGYCMRTFGRTMETLGIDPIFNLLTRIVLFGVPAYLIAQEYRAGYTNQHKPHKISLSEGKLYYMEAVYPLNQLEYLGFGQRTWLTTAVEFKFQDHDTLLIYAELNPEEKQLLLHGVNTYARKHLSDEEARKIEHAQNLS